MISHYSHAVSSRDHAGIVASQFTLRCSCLFSGNPYNTLVGVTLSGTALLARSQSRSKTGGQYRKDPLEVLFFAESAVGNGEDRHKTI